MANEFKLAYANTLQIDITAQVFRGDPLVALETPAVTLIEDVLGIYAGDTDDCTLQAGDMIVYYDGGVIIGSEIYQPETDLSTLTTLITDLITLLTPVTSLPLPAISIDTIKTILQFTDTEYDDQLLILIPVIEDIVVNYCGVSAISDLSIGAIFPIAGLVRYAMENPIGAKSQTVGSDRTEYGEFPNALLKLLDNFKPDITGGYANAEVINLNDINEELGL